MTCKDVIEYLSTFTPETQVAFLIADLKARMRYPVEAYQFLIEAPVVILELAQPESLDELVEACSDDE